MEDDGPHRHSIPNRLLDVALIEPELCFRKASSLTVNRSADMVDDWAC
jgi:hypothetical protein